VVDRGRTVRDTSLVELGRSVALALGAVGPINVQCRVVDGRPMIFEINPRFSGGIPLTIAAGADFPRALVLMARGRAPELTFGEFEDKLWMTSYETSVFVAESSIGFSPKVQIREVA
jgi:carbamoyl-phosphate synthase large subunit